MNLKADRIESIVQVLNRNLLLICVGQTSGITPIETRSLRRIDTSVFASDKFAFEMVEFAKSYRKPTTLDMAAEWERQFVRGLELLLAECAVVKDEIERDCFVSRIYAWFMEKLSERRDLDREKDSRSKRREPDPEEVEEGEDDLRKEQFPPTSTANSGGGTAGQRYNGQAYPRVQGTRPPGESAAPADNTGMLFLEEPQTEAELEMHNLWLAKRQQEAFDLKARHQLAVVMDRRSLHKSRLESEALRRLESSTFLAASFDTHSPGKRPARPLSAGNSRYAPVVKRPMSGKRQYKSALENGYEEMAEQRRHASDRAAPGAVAGQPSAVNHFPDPEDAGGLEQLSLIREEGPCSLVSPAPGTDSSGAVPVRVKTQSGKEESHSVAKSGRSVVEKPKPEFKPMKFKSSLPDGFVARQKKVKDIALEHYLQEFDSDEEKDIPPSASLPRNASKPASIAVQSEPPAPPVKPMQKSRSMPAGSGIAAILAKRDPIRDRPVSAQKFREISATDSEMKVLYRYSNFRRMPLTEEQEKWLNNRENKRISESKDKLRKLAEEKAAKAKKADKKGAKKAEAKPSKKKAPEKPAPPPKIIKKYASAGDFMDTHFPNFDNDENEDAIGPMRAEQLAECADVYHCLSMADLVVSEQTIRRALLVPQDRPEAVCLENSKNPIEGLMTNPLPKEYWRKVVVGAGKKKKKGGGKKQKKK